MIKYIESSIRIHYYSREYGCDQECTASMSHENMPSISLAVHYAGDKEPTEYILCCSDGVFWLADPSSEIFIRLHAQDSEDGLYDSLDILDIEEEKTECLAAAIHYVINHEWTENDMERSQSTRRRYLMFSPERDLPF